MPLYEYTCETCHSDFELLVRASDVPACPDCGRTALTRRLSVPAAPVHASRSSLPLAGEGTGGGCGRPQCGLGYCAGME